ncbi:MAG: hypothetical protein Q4B65_00130, partial [Candidatus Saccharibacteria bacterium]|nr:hypothetical protein [Candidatus Saccharibacteria bacterium]
MDKDLYRGAGFGGTYQWTQANWWDNVPGTIDVAKFKEGATTRTEGDATVYERDIYAYRCFAPNTNCYSDKSTVRLKEKKGVSTDYAAASQISNRKGASATGGAWKGTGIVWSYEEENTDPINIQEGGEAELTFSHNVYANQPNAEISWNVTRTVSGDVSESGFSSNSYYTVRTDSDRSLSSGQTGSSMGGAAVSAGETGGSGYYIGQVGGGLPYRDTEAGNQYILRDYYKVTFNKSGRYRFCESMYVNGAPLTTVCTTVVVSPVLLGTCGDTGWLPDDYETGTTSVLSRVNNGRLEDSANAYKGWQGERDASSGLTYAMPGDLVEWRNCYYPGVQKYYSDDVTALYRNGSQISDTTHKEGCSGEIVEKPLYYGITWNNWFRYETNSPFGLNDG